VVLTRAAEDNRTLADILRGRGIPVLEVPCIGIRHCLPDTLPEHTDAVVFTSRRGVRALVEQGLWERLLARTGKTPAGASGRPLIGAVGQATADELASHGIPPDLVADPPEGEELARLLIERLKRGQTITAVRGNLRAGGLDQALKEAGYDLFSIQVYENFEPEIPPVEPAPVAGVFVASPSAARRLLQRNPWLGSARFFAIGKTTRRAIRQMGVASVETIGPSLEDWVEALCRAHERAVGLRGS
jgi:uroporphyrinogen-III synthase